jgi:hypothetical protein
MGSRDKALEHGSRFRGRLLALSLECACGGAKSGDPVGLARFDRGFAAARKRLDEGAIGDAVVFKSTSRDPYRPSIEYANPRTSGGLIIDMGIHDFDLARCYMGDVAAVQAIGGLLAYVLV